MPRKQRVPKARRASGDGLRHELVDLLLADQPTPAAIDALHAAGVEYDQWFEFAYSLSDAAVLRRQHRQFLVDEAQRRGLGGAAYLDRVAVRLEDAWRLSLRPASGDVQ